MKLIVVMVIIISFSLSLFLASMSILYDSLPLSLHFYSMFSSYPTFPLPSPFHSLFFLSPLPLPLPSLSLSPFAIGSQPPSVGWCTALWVNTSIDSFYRGEEIFERRAGFRRGNSDARIHLRLGVSVCAYIHTYRRVGVQECTRTHTHTLPQKTLTYRNTHRRIHTLPRMRTHWPADSVTHTQKKTHTDCNHSSSSWQISLNDRQI